MPRNIQVEKQARTPQTLPPDKPGIAHVVGRLVGITICREFLCFQDVYTSSMTVLR